MISRFTQLYDLIGVLDILQIAVMTLIFFGILRLLAKSGAGSWIGRGVGILVVGLFLLAQVVIASLDLTELSNVLDYLLSTFILGLLVIFQPELRRGLMMLGRNKIWQTWSPAKHAIADPLADAAESLSRNCIGALIAIQREVSLASFIETGERIDSRLSSALIRTIFWPKCPLHDGAAIVVKGRLQAAACQLPMRSTDNLAESSPNLNLGMRHRAAISLSEETDALVLVVSEETGRVSLAFGGRLEPVARENLARRLVELLNTPTSLDRASLERTLH